MPQRAWEDFSNCFLLRTKSFIGESTFVQMHHQTASVGELFLQGWRVFDLFIHVIWLLSALFHQTCVSFPFIVNLGMLADQGRGTNLVNIKMFSGEIMIESKSQDIQKTVVLADQVSSSVLATHQCLRAQSRSLTLPQRFPKHCGHVCCMYVLCVSVCA